MQSRVETPGKTRPTELSSSKFKPKRKGAMLIEVLYVPGCPNHLPAVRRLQDVLRSEAVNVEIQEVVVTDEAMAHSLRFQGSPTVRINGLDAEPSSEPKFGLACRLYSGGSGVPSEQVLSRAVKNAKQKEDSE